MLFNSMDLSNTGDHEVYISLSMFPSMEIILLYFYQCVRINNPWP